MNSRIFFLAGSILSLVAVAAKADTLIFSDNFDGLNTTLALSQQNNWTTNDPYNATLDVGQTDVVAKVAGYSTSNSDYWAILGGLSPYTPGVLDVKVWNPFSTTGILTGAPTANALSFGLEFGISGSATPSPNRDAFGWSFQTAAGTSVAKFSLEPVTVSGNALLRLHEIDAVNGDTTTSLLLPYNSIFNMDIQLVVGGVADSWSATFVDGLNNTFTVTGALAAGSAQSVGQIAPEWQILNPAVDGNGVPTAYGNNSMIFNDYSVKVVQAVPEPASVVLLACGLAGVVGMRRRTRS